MEPYDETHVFFSDPIKNNIINDGYFIRILYSNELITLNGVYMLLRLHDIQCEKYYSKYKCCFNVEEHMSQIEQIQAIEDNLLKKYKTNKIPFYKIVEQLKSGFIKIFDDLDKETTCSVVLKISGIWETAFNYGLTYKFVIVKPQPS